MNATMKAWHVGDDIYAAETAEQAIGEAMRRTDRPRREIMQGGPITECSLDCVVYEDDDYEKAVKVGDIIGLWTKPGVIAEDRS